MRYCPSRTRVLGKDSLATTFTSATRGASGQRNAAIAARVAELEVPIIEAAQEALQTNANVLIAKKIQRIESYERDFAAMMELRQARANDPAHQDVPGIKTGLLVVSYVAAGKVSRKEAKFDATLLREMRELRKQMAIELNQWSEKVEHKFDPMEWLRTASVEELRAALPALRAEREKLGLPAPPKLKPNR
jgi:hypothetical protein